MVLNILMVDFSFPFIMISIDMEYMCEGSMKIWCPRIHISVNTTNLVNESESHSIVSSLFSPSTPFQSAVPSSISGLLSFSPFFLHLLEGTTKVCLGRGVVYREERCVQSFRPLIVLSFMIFILLHDWECEVTDSSGRYHMTPTQLTHLLSDLQDRVSSAISSSKERVNATSQSLAQAPSPKGRSPATITTAEILDCVGFIYSNDCNAAFKVTFLSREIFIFLF